MKTHLLLCTFTAICLGCIASQAQEYEYVPFVRENVEWFDGDKYRFIGDTIVEGKTYKKCYQSNSCPFEDNMRLYGLAREEDRVVYCLRPSDEQEEMVEEIIYDFRAEKAGDRVYLSWENTYYDENECIIAQIDTILVNDGKRRRIELQNSYQGIYIEGIGSIGPRQGLFHLLFTIPTEIGYTYKTLDYVKNIETGEYEYVNGRKDPCEMEYIPFVKTADWTYYDAGPGDGVTTFPRYHLSGDESDRVTVNGHDYYRLYSYTGCDFNTADTRRELVLVREEEQKVYVLDSIEDTYVDKLLYDFTLNVGDTLRMDEGSYFHRPEVGDDWNDIAGRKRCNDRYQRDVFDELDPYSGFEVTSIESIVVAGKPRKAIHWNNGNTWVVGLGEISEYPLAQFYMDYSSCTTPPFYLLYQKSNGEYSYEVLDLHQYTPDPCLSGIDDNKAYALRIARTPDALVVTLPGDGYRLAELIDTTGRLVWCEYLDGEPGEVSVPTTALAPGVYVVALTDNRGKRTVQKVGWQ